MFILNLTSGSNFGEYYTSIPIALAEAWEEGKLKRGDLLVLASFGSGFTWGSAIIRW